jgi:hypothetical protein
MSLSATHSQNTQSQTITMTLPTFQASVDRIFLFAPADAPKKGIIKNINIQYTVNAKNDIITTDSLFFKPQMFRDAKNGMEHTIPISTNFKILKYLSVTPSLNYREVWTTKTVKKSFDVQKDKEIVEDVNGFDSYRTYSFSSGIGTTIYGTFNFGDDKIIKSIRHKMMPSITYNYVPSFERYYETYAANASGTTVKEYSRFENSIYGAPGKSFSNVMSFSLNNTFEAKVRDKDSTKTEPKKIVLLSNLNFTSGYDLNTKVLEPIRVTGATMLFKDKMTVNFGAELDMYAINNTTGGRSEVFNINNGGSLLRVTGANMAVNYSFSSKKDDGKDKKNETQGQRNGGRPDELFGRSVDLNDNRQGQFDNDEEKEEKFAGFYNAKLPWDLILAYSLTYSNVNRERQITNNSLMVNGNLDISPKWKIGVSTGYDFVLNGINNAQLSFDRDLLSWRMSFNWSPIGENSQWGFFIGVKAGILSDLKWEKRKIPDLQRR